MNNLVSENIIALTTDSGVSIIYPINVGEKTIEEYASSIVPDGTLYRIIHSNNVPNDQTFMKAWELDAEITVNLDKAKYIAHDKRRKDRDAEFAPYDNIIMKQIPGNSFQEAEAQRQLIREKYAVMQTEIDQATTPEELKTILKISP